MNAYTNIRFKSYDQGVMWLENHAELIALGLGYEAEDVRRVMSDLEQQVDEMVAKVRETYGRRLDEVLTGKRFKFAVIGCSFSSEYLSYFNVVKTILESYDGIEVIDGAVTAETVPQTVAHIYERVLQHKPDISSLFMGINDMRRNNDVYTKCNVEPKEFHRDMNYLVNVLKDCGSEVIMHTLTPCNVIVQEKSAMDRRWTYRIDDWDVFNGIIKDIAEVTHCPLNDQTKYMEDFEGQANIPENGLHLTQEAQEYLTYKFIDVLLDTVEKKYGMK